MVPFFRREIKRAESVPTTRRRAWANLRSTSRSKSVRIAEEEGGCTRGHY